MSPTTARCTVLALSSESRWPSTPTATSRRRVTRPASGSRTPASTDNRLDLPSPFLPTMPMRSPSLTPRVTSFAISLVGNSRCTLSQPSKMAICTCSSHSYSQPFILAGSGALTAGVEGVRFDARTIVSSKYEQSTGLLGMRNLPRTLRPPPQPARHRRGPCAPTHLTRFRHDSHNAVLGPAHPISALLSQAPYVPTPLTCSRCEHRTLRLSGTRLGPQ